MDGLSFTRPARWALAASLIHFLFAVSFGAEPPAKHERHPLDHVIRWAEDALEKSAQVKDYTALLIKRERIGDRLQEYQYIQLKVRHEPFSIYMKFLRPESVKGREVIYVDSQNDGMLLAHETGGLGKIVGTVSLAPDGMIAMRGQRYPVTMIGFKNLGQKLMEEAKRDRRIKAPCDVKFFEGAKVNGRPTYCIQVAHPVRHPEHQFSMARVFIDQELGIPIRYEGYTWPEKPGGDPVLVEEYTYSRIKLNVGLTDKDFDPQNPQYNFKAPTVPTAF